MTVAELIEFLKVMPQHYTVYIEYPRETAMEADRVEPDDSKNRVTIL